jgi:signal transduction histidine kinase
LSNGKFTVDTHLFRELGELLVARDSTALTELIKNAYDADATQVTVNAEGLGSASRGQIVVTDNGNGMTREQFESGFLRIASRMKDQGERRSSRLNRRFTGAKGIGRLAAHKLARLLVIRSVARDPKTGRAHGAFEATIDWTKVEKAEILDDIQADAITIREFSPGTNAKPGTTLELRGLRRAWSKREIDDFVRQARDMTPPKFMLESAWLSKSFAGDLLFEAPRLSSPGAENTSFGITLSGALETGDDYIIAASRAATWLLDVQSQRGQLVANVSPSVEYARTFGDARHRRVKVKAESVMDGPFATEHGCPEFSARVLYRAGDWQPGTDGAASWRKVARGVRAYLEGFRVLPYGEPGDDWLRLDEFYNKRSRASDSVGGGLFEDDDDQPSDRNEPLSRPPNRQVLGGVFLTLDGAPTLKMLVNREGFIPDVAFHFVESSLRWSIDVLSRELAVATASKRLERREQRREGARDTISGPASNATSRVAASISDSVELLRQARRALAAGDSDTSKKVIDTAFRQLEARGPDIEESREDQAMLRVLASLGSQTAAFVHETQGLLGIAESAERAMHRLASADSGHSKQTQRAMLEIGGSIRDLRETLERQAAYLSDVGSASARKRRSSQNLHERLGVAMRFFEHHADRYKIIMENRIPESLKSPPMFPAEIVSIFSNLLSNAIKAAGEGGKIRAAGKELASKTVVRVENTGIAVDPAKGEKWFKPFASSAGEVDVGLGRGMGLGLTITRQILGEYGAEIRFAEPSSGFATCLEISFPN